MLIVTEGPKKDIINAPFQNFQQTGSINDDGAGNARRLSVSHALQFPRVFIQESELPNK